MRNLCLVPAESVPNDCGQIDVHRRGAPRHSILCQGMCQWSAKSFRSSKAYLQMSHGHSRLDIEAGTLEGCRHVAHDGSTVIGRLIRWSSLTAEHRDRGQCREQKLRDMHSEAVQCEGLFICVVAKELGAELKLAFLSDKTRQMGLGRMKHVELRFLFVRDLLERERLTLCKISGTENHGDLGKKVLDVNTHRHLCSIIGLGLAKQAVVEIKGDQRNSQPTGSVWTAERVERSEKTGSWIGAMGTRTLRP